jgi:hypothetical protein
LVTEVAMRRFLARVPDYHLVADSVAWNSSSNFRSPTALSFARASWPGYAATFSGTSGS